MASISKEITTGLEGLGLNVLGGFSTEPSDIGTVAPSVKSIAMIGPDEPRFWPIFNKSSEYRDGLPDPMDRWSSRVLNDIGQRFELDVYFPFGGPPYVPFYQWALRTGRVFASPTRLLVHDKAGLFVSFRGALGFSVDVNFSASHSPCTGCDAPCMNTCPVKAFDGESYDTIACNTEIRQGDRLSCLTRGCAARRACPVSQNYGRLEAQSNFHMKNFTGLS